MLLMTWPRGSRGTIWNVALVPATALRSPWPLAEDGAVFSPMYDGST